MEQSVHPLRIRIRNMPRTLIGIGWMIATGLSFSMVTGIVHWLGTDMPVAQGTFLRFVFGIVLVAPVLWRFGRRRPSRNLVRLSAIRGVLQAVAAMLWFFAMARLAMAEVTAISYLGPLYVTVGAALFLGERLHARRIAAVMFGFAGVLIILRPGFETIGAGQIAQLLATPLFSISYLVTKRLTDDENPMEIVAMMTVFTTLALLPGAVLQWRPPTPIELGCLALTAVFGTFGHYALTRAFRAAPITVTQPIIFLQLVWSAAMGLAFFGETLDPYIFVGAAVIVTAATYIAHREARAERHERTAPATVPGPAAGV